MTLKGKEEEMGLTGFSFLFFLPQAKIIFGSMEILIIILQTYYVNSLDKVCIVCILVCKQKVAKENLLEEK